MENDEKGQKNTRKPLEKIASGVFDRGLRLAKFSAGFGLRSASHAITHAFSTEEERAEGVKKLLLTQFKILAQELGELKGSLMKTGQMLSVVGESFFPPEVVSVLRSLQSHSPPLAYSALEPTLRAELKSSFDYLEIDSNPIAAASLGQVHLAVDRRDPERRQIALKIQYPGVEKAIEGDLKLLRRVLDLSKILPSGKAASRADAIFAEVREMLYQEVNYVKELELTEKYRSQLLRDLPHPERYVLPKTLPEFSSGRVLATTYEPGLELSSPQVALLSQLERDALAQSILELYLTEVFRWHMVQTDPHFGNYRVRAPEKVILYDFGAVREFSAEFMSVYTPLTVAGFYRDRAGLLKAGENLGFLEPSDSEAHRQSFVELCLLICEPFHENAPYDWANSDLPRRVARKAGELVIASRLRQPPREIVFLDRKMVGIFSILKTLGPKFIPREIMEPFLKPFSASKNGGPALI